MNTKKLIKDLKSALSQDHLYNGEELEYMREQLELLELSVKKKKLERNPKDYPDKNDC